MALKYLPLLVALSSFPLLAQDQGSGDSSSGSFVVKLFPERQAERRQSRWTLGTWMKTKRQIEEQNRWLWAHTNKIPLEFALAYVQSPTRWNTELDLFVARLGLRASYGKRSTLFKDANAEDTGPRDDTAQLAAQIRLFGGNLQDTYLMARIGYEYAGLGGAGALGGGFGSWFVEPELQIYFAQWLGVRAKIHQRFSGQNLTRKDQKWSGRNTESVAFIEMGALRLEGGYRWMNWNVDSASPLHHNEIVTAAKLFF